jgi:DNA-binding NarL/FixJ family response regulator
MTIRLVLADDDALVRAGIGMLLGVEPDLEVVAEVGDGAAAVEAVRRLRADVAVLDVRMPGVDGVEATRRLTGDTMTAALGRTVAVLVLTTFHVSEAVYAALRAGASGFVLKDAAPAELVAAVRAVAEGEAWLDPAVARQLIAEFARRPQSGLPPPTEVSALTPREREVLVLIAHGMSNTEIARHLVVEAGTVKTHVSRILMKLGVRDRSQAVAVAYRSRLVGPSDPVPPPAGR